MQPALLRAETTGHCDAGQSAGLIDHRQSGVAQRDSEVLGPVGDRSAADCGTLIVLAGR